MAKIHHTSNTLYPKLEKMAGQATGWHGCGGIRLATRPEELDYFRLVQGTAASIGFRMEIIGPDEIKRLNPFLDTTGVVAGAWTNRDSGRVKVRVSQNDGRSFRKARTSSPSTLK